MRVFYTILEWIALKRCIVAVLGLFVIGSSPSMAAHKSFINTPLLGGTQASTADLLHSEPIKPVPLSVDTDPRLVVLGKRLFEDSRLSRDGSMACQTCHYLDQGGADGEMFSPSIDGEFRVRNTPTIFNTGLYTLYGWYGTSQALEDLVESIIKSKKGLASDWDLIIPMLKSDMQYRTMFESGFQDGVTVENTKLAIAEYLRFLNTPNARFDKYLRGDTQAINQEELEGYRLFKSYGCASCHQGVAVGANMIAPFNLFRNYLDKDHTSSQLETGRYNQTKEEADKYSFRVPSLRNVALTAPYLHDGSATSLESAIDIMGRYMLGRKIPKPDQRLIVEFLKTLTGELEGKPL